MKIRYMLMIKPHLQRPKNAYVKTSYKVFVARKRVLPATIPYLRLPIAFCFPNYWQVSLLAKWDGDLWMEISKEETLASSLNWDGDLWMEKHSLLRATITSKYSSQRGPLNYKAPWTSKGHADPSSALQPCGCIVQVEASEGVKFYFWRIFG